MNIENGKFYFIKDEFFNLFKGYKLMENKENGNKRPCYFCFKDDEEKNIIWFVPISSRVEKYKRIYAEKKKRRKNVYNFVFGDVLGKEKVFLIQNIFPTTEKYIINKYKHNNKDVEIANTLRDEVINQSINVIQLAKEGIQIPFYDILEMKEILLEDNKNRRLVMKEEPKNLSSKYLQRKK